MAFWAPDVLVTIFIRDSDFLTVKFGVQIRGKSRGVSDFYETRMIDRFKLLFIP